MLCLMWVWSGALFCYISVYFCYTKRKFVICIPRTKVVMSCLMWVWSGALFCYIGVYFCYIERKFVICIPRIKVVFRLHHFGIKGLGYSMCLPFYYKKKKKKNQRSKIINKLNFQFKLCLSLHFLKASHLFIRF